MRKYFFICFSWWIIALAGYTQLTGRLYVGPEVDKTTGFVKSPDSVFRLVPPQTRVLIEYRNDRPLMIDTLFMVIKSVSGATLKYYMKKGRNGKSVYGKIFFKKEGIYRVAIFNPKQLSRPITSMRLYITSPTYPTIASLIERQKKILVERGKLKENTTAKNNQNPATNNPKSNTPPTNNTQTAQNKPATNPNPNTQTAQNKPATNPNPNTQTAQNKPATNPNPNTQTATTAKPNTATTNKPTNPTTAANPKLPVASDDDDEDDNEDEDSKNPADKDDDKNYAIDDEDVLDIDIDASDVDEASLQIDEDDEDDLDDL